MDFEELLRILRRRWRGIVAMFALAVIASAVMSLTATKIYQSSARLFISTDVTTTTDAYAASVFASSRVSSYAELATSTQVLQRVIDTLHLDTPVSSLAPQVVATVPSGTSLIQIVVRDRNPKLAQSIAQTEAEQLASYLDQVESPAGKNVSPIKASISDAAAFNGTPVLPRTTLNLAIAALLGLLLGFAVAFVRDMLDSTIKSPEDIEAITESPVLAHVALDPTIAKYPLLTHVGSNSPRAEAFRLLRTNLQFVDLDAAPKSFVVTSALPGEGKTSTSMNLAMALAQTGKRVLLVDGDLRRPQTAERLGLETAVGFTTILVGRSGLDESIQHHPDSGIDFLASGPLPPNPTEILQSNATASLLKTLHNRYDAVIVDAPPLLPVADAAILTNAVDGALIVVRHGRTTKDQLRHALGRIEHVGGRTFGILVNMSPKRRHRGYDDGYGYGYGYGYGFEPPTSEAPKHHSRSTQKAKS